MQAHEPLSFEDYAELLSAPVEHREADRFTLLREAARIVHGVAGAWIYDEWQRLNLTCFDSTLKVPGLDWGLTSYGMALAYYQPHLNKIVLHPSLLWPKDRAWGQHAIMGPRQASDVLLHEMIHQSIYQRLGHSGARDGTSSHNNPHWCDEINRLAPILGIECAPAQPVKQRRLTPEEKAALEARDGKERKSNVAWIAEPGFLSMRQMSGFPDVLREDGYYEATGWSRAGDVLNLTKWETT